MAIIDKINIRGNQYDLRDNDAQAAIAPLYSTSATYAVGDYVMHDGAYYVCKTAIATPESWTAGHWMQTNVGAEVGGLKSALAQDETLLIACESGTFKDGDGITKLANVARIRNKLPISITGFDSIIIPNGYQAWVFRLNANKTLISAMSGWQTGTLNMAAIATADTKYLNFGIKKTGSETADISEYIEAVSAGLVLTTTAFELENAVFSQRNFSHWTIGEIAANGHTIANSSKAVSSFETYRQGIGVIPEAGCNLVLFFYDADKAYLGKVATDGSINKTGGDWKKFTSRIEIDDYAPSDAKYFIIQITATDGTTFTWDNVSDFANSHVKINDTSIDEINETLTSISETMFINHVDQHDLLSIPDSYIGGDGWYNVYPSKAYSKYNTNPFPAKAFKESTQYTLSFDAKYTGTVGTTLCIGFHYTDQTRQDVTVRGEDENHYVLTSASGKTVERIYMTYNNSILTSVKNFMVVEGTTEPDVFIPYDSETAVDLIARDAAKRANTELAPIRENVANLIQSDTGARMTTFTVQAGSTHSSLNNQIELSADEGSFIYCVATGLQGRSGSVYVRNDETEQSVANLTEGIIARVKAPFDIKRMGLYVGSGAEKVNISFAAFTDKSILARLTEKTEYDNLYLTKLLNAKRKANPGNYNKQTSPEIFTLAHFSDIHGNSWAMKQVQEFKDAYQAQLDDVICTGDVVTDKLADGTAFWSNNSDGKILICIGNHDSLGSNGWANPVDQQTLYETYIEPYEDSWGAETVSGHSYWYKDYSDKKIRLIAIDATIYDATEQASQMTWLNAALSGAITNGYAVVGAVHFPPMPANFHKVDSNFTALLHGTAGDMSQFAWHTYHTDILEAVDQFIDNGGDFVCWLSGHTHYDLVSYDDRFPKQLFITISCAMPSSLFEEKIRDTGRGAGLVLNTVCVDTVRKYVKLLRYGAEWDDCLRHTGTCVIKYDANPPTVMFSN